jgi:hypothetical protein
MTPTSIKQIATINRKFLVLILAVAALLFVTDSAYSQTVRGRLDREGRYGYYPVAYVQVTLNAPDMGRSLPIYTDIDGMYYFHDVPPGDYILEIWVYPDRLLSYRIHVFNQRYVDIEPILLP